MSKNMKNCEKIVKFVKNTQTNRINWIKISDFEYKCQKIPKKRKKTLKKSKNASHLAIHITLADHITPAYHSSMGCDITPEFDITLADHITSENHSQFGSPQLACCLQLDGKPHHA